MDKKEFTVSEVIDAIGIGKHTWVVFVLLAFAMIFDGYDFMIVNSTNLFVAHTFWPDNANPGALMGSLTTWGLFLAWCSAVRSAASCPIRSAARNRWFCR